MEENKHDNWKRIIDMTNEAGFDMLELNMSCPHGMTELGMGRFCGEIPDVLGEITGWCVKLSEVPVLVKLTPNYGEITDLAKVVKEAGGHGVTAINTVPTLFDPDADGTPFQPVGEKRQMAYGGGCGNMVRPIALRKVSEIARQFTGFPISGVGGISSADHVLSHLRMGASIIQVCSAVQEQDYTVADDLSTGLKAHM